MSIADDIVNDTFGPDPDPPTDGRPLAYRAFPVALLPEPLATFVRRASKSIGCDAAFVAMPALTACAAAIGTTRTVKLSNTWTEPSILWSGIVGESGTQKSPAFRLAMKPLYEAQGVAMQQHTEEMTEHERRAEAYDAEHRNWRKNGDGEPPEKPEPPIAPRFIVADTTVEALAPMLADNPRGLLMARDELSGWLGSFDRYSNGKGADVSHYLSMFNADRLVYDRKTNRESIYIPRASLSICGGIQPSILDRALGREHRDSGLAARLLLAHPPRRAKRWTDEDIDPSIEAKYALLIDDLREQRHAPIRAEDGQPEPVAVTLDDEALKLFADFVNRHGDEQLDMTGDLAAAWSKLEGYAARLALIVHCVRVKTGDPTLTDPDRIDAQSITVGIQLARWFGHEARRIYAAFGATDAERQQSKLAEIIQRKGGKVTVAEWQRTRHIKTRKAAEASLADLESDGYGTLDYKPQTGPGRPSIVFTLHGYDGATLLNPASDAVSGNKIASQRGEGGAA